MFTRWRWSELRITGVRGMSYGGRFDPMGDVERQMEKGKRMKQLLLSESELVRLCAIMHESRQTSEAPTDNIIVEKIKKLLSDAEILSICTVCEQPIGVHETGAETGKRFAHAECYHRREMSIVTARAEQYKKELEQLLVQLGGCLTAAEGATKNPAKRGDYGWSPAYQAVLDLRLKYEELIKHPGLPRSQKMHQALEKLHVSARYLKENPMDVNEQHVLERAKEVLVLYNQATGGDPAFLEPIDHVPAHQLAEAWRLSQKEKNGDPALDELAKRLLVVESWKPLFTDLDKKLPALEKRINGAAFNADEASTTSKALSKAWEQMTQKLGPLFRRVDDLEAWSLPVKRVMEGASSIQALKKQGEEVISQLKKVPPDTYKFLEDLPTTLNNLQLKLQSLEISLQQQVAELSVRIAKVAHPLPSHPYRDDRSAVPAPIEEPHTRVKADDTIVFKLPGRLNQALQALVSAGNEYRRGGNERGFIMTALNLIQVYEDYVR